MNNEPVAWVDFEGEVIPKEFVKWFKDEGYTCIPLYTHPAKTLTDEEILEYADAFGMDMGNSYEIGHGQFILAVRAILRKANE